MEATTSGKMDYEDRMILDITRTGAAWTRTAAFWAGQADDKTCQLCGEEEEHSWHSWTCKALKEERNEADKDLANIDPEKLPMPIRHGIAPAMGAKGATTFWGTSEDNMGEDQITEEQMRMMGGCMENELEETIREEMQRFPIDITAREYIQFKADEKGKCNLPMPRNEDEMPPEEHNVHTDGSLHNPTSRHWQVGGMGIFWPDRKLEQPIAEYES